MAIPQDGHVVVIVDGEEEDVDDDGGVVVMAAAETTSSPRTGGALSIFILDNRSRALFFWGEFAPKLGGSKKTGKTGVYLEV